MPAMQLPDFSVSGKVALFTGAGRGIGLAMARALAAAGAAVALQDIDEAVARAEADAINAAGGKALALGGDLADPKIAEMLIARTTEAFGGLHILVNNGSVQIAGKFDQQTVEQMRWQLDVNIVTATRLCQLALPLMLAGKWGRIINMGSVQGRGGNYGMTVYAMTRAAMSNLSSSLARRCAADGITVNCIAPGWFNTYRNRGDLVSDDVVAERGKRLPAGRLGRPEDCAGLGLLLCSAAGEYITGQTIFLCSFPCDS